MAVLESESVAKLVTGIGTSNFGRTLLEAIDPDQEAAHCVAFQLHDGENPKCIFSCSRLPGFDVYGNHLAEEYSNGFFQIDPVLSQLNDVTTSTPKVNFIDVRKLISKRSSSQSEYLDKFYRLSDRSDQADFSLRDGNRLLWVSLYRYPGSTPFGELTRARLDGLSSLVLACTSRQADLIQPVSTVTQKNTTHAETAVCGDERPGELWDESRTKLRTKIRFSLLRDPAGLSYREADVCAQIVMGYTAFAISLNLGLSVNTVATHRKRAYAKLGISAQTELFNYCLRNSLFY